MQKSGEEGGEFALVDGAVRHAESVLFLAFGETILAQRGTAVFNNLSADGANVAGEREREVACKRDGTQKQRKEEEHSVTVRWHMQNVCAFLCNRRNHTRIERNRSPMTSLQMEQM